MTVTDAIDCGERVRSRAEIKANHVLVTWGREVRQFKTLKAAEDWLDWKENIERQGNRR